MFTPVRGALVYRMVYTTFGREKSLTHGSETIVRRKKRKKRRKATGELDKDPDALHLARDPNRHIAFGREACTSARGRRSPGSRDRSP